MKNAPKLPSFHPMFHVYTSRHGMPWTRIGGSSDAARAKTIADNVFGRGDAAIVTRQTQHIIHRPKKRPTPKHNSRLTRQLFKRKIAMPT